MSSAPAIQSDSTFYPVRAILCHWYAKRQDRFFFKVEWEEKDVNGKHKVGTIALENFIGSPAPVFAFVEKHGRTFSPGKHKKQLQRRVCKTEYIAREE